MKAEIYVMSTYCVTSGRHLDFTYILMSDRVVTNPSVLHDPDNTGIAVGISYPSCAQAELHIRCYVLGAAILSF